MCNWNINETKTRRNTIKRTKDKKIKNEYWKILRNIKRSTYNDVNPVVLIYDNLFPCTLFVYPTPPW